MELGGPQPVKVLSPEILFLMERAEVIFNTVGNILRRAAASGVGAPGVEGRSSLTSVMTVTREIRGSLPRGSMPVRPPCQ